MAGLNQVILIGRLGQDPNLMNRNGLSICKFTLATSQKMKNGNEKTQWHRCVAFNKSAEIINQYVKKGDQFSITGSISYSQYEKEGVTVYSTEIIVTNFTFLNNKRNDTQNYVHTTPSTHAPTVEVYDDSEIPF